MSFVFVFVFVFCICILYLFSPDTVAPGQLCTAGPTPRSTPPRRRCCTPGTICIVYSMYTCNCMNIVHSAAVYILHIHTVYYTVLHSWNIQIVYYVYIVYPMYTYCVTCNCMNIVHSAALLEHSLYLHIVYCVYIVHISYVYILHVQCTQCCTPGTFILYIMCILRVYSAALLKWFDFLLAQIYV